MTFAKRPGNTMSTQTLTLNLLHVCMYSLYLQWLWIILFLSCYNFLALSSKCLMYRSQMASKGITETLLQLHLLGDEHNRNEHDNGWVTKWAIEWTMKLMSYRTSNPIEKESNERLVALVCKQILQSIWYVISDMVSDKRHKCMAYPQIDWNCWNLTEVFSPGSRINYAIS